MLLLFCRHTFAAPCDNEKTVYVGIGSAWAPYVMYQQDRAFGLEIEITQTVFSKAGYCVEFVKLPTTDRAIRELSVGLVDVLPSSSFNTERAKVGAFTEPYRRERMRLFTYLPIEPIENLGVLFDKKTSFVINKGAFYGDEFNSHFVKGKNKDLFAFVKTVKQRMQMVHLERVDFLVEDEMAGLYYFSTYQGNKIKLHPYLVNDNAIHFMLNKDRFSQKEIESINLAISNSKAVIDEAIARYTTPSIGVND